jgi:para-aminobenzoate synthetase/4-amino-4-deoxychorismate lyase
MANQSPSGCYRLLQNSQNYVFLETSKYDRVNYRSRLFIEPVATLWAYTPEELPALFAKIEQVTGQGLYAAGYLHYECGEHFETGGSIVPGARPIAWFGVYREPLIYNHQTGSYGNSTSCIGERISCTGWGEYRLGSLKFQFEPAEYYQKIAQIKEYIAAGDVYQINFTGKYRFAFAGSPLAFYRQLRQKQPVAYSAVLNDGQRDILCLSPELFFRTENNRIMARPMKGTAPRGRNRTEDTKIADWLRQDEKNRAENLMIVDLLRNDLGRIAEIGSVKVPEIFTVETYRTLFQMTSTVVGELLPGLSYYDIFKALFPCGSITGAPKVRAMRLIKELENGMRGVYTGAIGYFGPDKESMFNVAIRTVVIEDGHGELGVGSGIVFDSDPEAEYAECLLKAEFLTEPALRFELLEAILWDRGYLLLDKHLERLQDSADYFEYPLDLDSLKVRLQQNECRLSKDKRYKVRLELNRQGIIRIENQELTDSGQAAVSLKAMISNCKTDSANRFLYHKTTHRHLYDSEYQNAIGQGFSEVIFTNEKDEVTEGAISNILIEKDGCWYTPPQNCGLLNGVYRSYLLKQRPEIKEKIVARKDLETADAIYICNSIRGLRKVSL